MNQPKTKTRYPRPWHATGDEGRTIIDDDGNTVALCAIPPGYPIKAGSNIAAWICLHANRGAPCTVPDGANAIAVERERQRAIGWSDKHDDSEHTAGQLVDAAQCYADTHDAGRERPGIWPFESRYWKPKDRRRNLVRAGAFIAAEIDRLDRAEAHAALLDDSAAVARLRTRLDDAASQCGHIEVVVADVTQSDEARGADWYCPGCRKYMTNADLKADRVRLVLPVPRELDGDTGG